MFSRLMSTSRGRSYYDELLSRNNHPDIEDRAGLLDEENLNQEFNPNDLEHAEGLNIEDSRVTLDSRREARTAARNGASLGQWATHHDNDGDNDVPASLLVEHHDQPPMPIKPLRTRQRPTVPGPLTGRNRADWEATRAQQRLHSNTRRDRPERSGPGAIFSTDTTGSDKEKAEWRWANVLNLDNFIKEAYNYYEGFGLSCILLERVLHLVQVAFIAVFLTFLTQCIDYSKLRGSSKLSQIAVPQCTQKMSWAWNMSLFVFVFYLFWKAIQYALDLPRLLRVRDFYLHLLNIPDHDMQTVTWQYVVARIMALRDQNPKTSTQPLSENQKKWIGSQSKERLDASDIANRLMRRENYLIALYNKDILDFTIPVPFFRSRQFLSRNLEWTIDFSILDFVFDEHGQIKTEFLKSEHRAELSEKLRTRFLFASLMSFVFVPFFAGFRILVHFMTYYTEYSRDPSSLGSRTYAPLAEWKFREFNELPHLFQFRLNMSREWATHYMDQFPKEKTTMVAKLVSFIAGSLAAVLGMVAWFDPDSFLSFEITPDRTVLFYLGIFISVWAFARGSQSEDHAFFDPEYAMQRVINHTHYQPDHWTDRLNSFEVKQEFSELYKVKLVIFAEEILGILVTPLILWKSLPRSCDQVIDFFREFTIHVDGLGYVCSFAEFDFSKGPGIKRTASAADVRDEYYSTKHNKMEMSYYGFMDNYGNHALNPRVGQKIHLPMRHQMHASTGWSANYSPLIGADMQASRVRGRNISRAPAKTPRSGTSVPSLSPMASILLDPHHQPAIPSVGRRRPGMAEGDVIEESLEDDRKAPMHLQTQEEPDEDGVALDESTWQTSPSKLSRENIGVAGHAEPDAGVVHLIKQFNQTQLNRRPGGRPR